MKRERSVDSGYNVRGLENIILSDRSWSRRPHALRFRLYEMSRMGQSLETGSTLVVVWDPEGKLLAGQGFVSETMKRS